MVDDRDKRYLEDIAPQYHPHALLCRDIAEVIQRGRTLAIDGNADVYDAFHSCLVAASELTMDLSDEAPRATAVKSAAGWLSKAVGAVAFLEEGKVRG